MPMPNITLTAPFTYPGGKSRIADLVWDVFGQVDCYIEPFCGSAAMALARPPNMPVTLEILNDIDGLLVNAWRSIAYAPDETVEYVDWWISELEQNSRHAWLLNRQDTLRKALEANPKYYDAEAAGYWVWLHNVYLNGVPCDGIGPWVHTPEGLVKRDTPGLSEYDRTKPGMVKQLPQLSGYGKCTVKPSLGNRQRLAHHQALHDWFARLADRLCFSTILCGEWQRGLSSFVTNQHQAVAVFLDPPYSNDLASNTKRAVVYKNDSLTLDHDVRSWCITHGQDRRMRIVLCGYGTVHDELLSHGWMKHRYHGYAGNGNRGKVGTPGEAHRKQEVLWVSPGCRIAQLPLF